MGQAIVVSPVVLKLISGLLSLLIIAFGSWAGVVWQTGESIAKAQAEQLSMVRMNEQSIRHFEKRTEKLETYLENSTNEIIKLREQMAAISAMLRSIQGKVVMNKKEIE